MNNKHISYFVMLFGMLLLSMEANAHTIKQGTISIGASAFNLSRNLEQGTDSDEYKISVSGSYFLKDNFEIGTMLSYDRFSSNQQKSTSWSLSPIIMYHIPLDENTNVYVGTGIFITNRDDDFSTGNKTTDESAGFTLNTGWEYFFNAHVAINIGLSFSRVTWDLTGHNISSDKETRIYWPRIGFRMFF